MSTKHTLEQLINISKDLFKTSSLNDAFIEFTSNKLSENQDFFNRYNDRLSKSFSSGYYAFKAYLMKKLK